MSSGLLMEWYYMDEQGEAQGPCSIQQVKAANQGRDDYHVYRAGMSEWRMVSTVLDFHQPEPVTPGNITPAVAKSPGVDPAARGSWQHQPVTEKQKAMLMLYGLNPRTVLTRGEASEVITRCQQSGMVPSSENQAKADKVFNELEREERARKTKQIVSDLGQAVARLHKKKLTVETVEDIRSLIDNAADELKDFCDELINELEDQAFHGETNDESIQ